MVTATRLSPIRRLRTKLGLSKARLAEALDVTLATLTQWELTLDGLTPAQLADIAVVLDVSIEVLIGDSDGEDGRLMQDPFREAAYGTLRISLASRALEYPIDQVCRSYVLDQLYKRDVQDQAPAGGWLIAETMDNKILLANLDYVQQVGLVSDDAEQMPHFEHPEVYKAISNWEVEGPERLGPIVLKRCEAAFEREAPENLEKSMHHARVVFGTGAEAWHFLLEAEDVVGYFGLLTEGENGIGPNCFIKVSSEGYHVEHLVNLSQVALIEVPLMRYLEISREAMEPSSAQDQ